MRPSRIIVGEVRQAESLDLLIALNSGLPEFRAEMLCDRRPDPTPPGGADHAHPAPMPPSGRRRDPAVLRRPRHRPSRCALSEVRQSPDEPRGPRARRRADARPAHRQQARLGDGHTPPRAGRHGQGHFPTQQAALKTLHLVTRGMHPKGTGAARWTMRWKPALNAFAVTFANRMPAAENSNRRTPEPPFVGQSVTSLRAPLLPGPDRS